MRIARWISTGISAGLFLTSTTAGLAQGSLEPGGAPAPTMKTLQQLEPRTPVGSLPYSITQPGSYYLTGPLSTVSSGIVIRCSDVTLDLKGFSLSRVGGAKFGIDIAGTDAAPIENVAVRNGEVSGFFIGVAAEHVRGCSFEALSCCSNSSSGIQLLHATACRVRACRLSRNAVGLLASQSSACDISDCTCSGNELIGISISDSDGNRVRGCRLLNTGIVVGQSMGNLIMDNQCRRIGAPNGIDTETSNGRNFVLRNLCWDAAISTDAGDVTGPLTSPGGVLDGNTSSNANPWANLLIP